MAAASTQLWGVCSNGAVYVLQDVGAWVSSMRSNEALHEKTITSYDNWNRSVDGRFDRVICGFGGLVCAKKDKILYLRRGVTYDNPLGTSWSKALCDAKDLAVGSRCIVRRTSQDQLFVADNIDLSSSIFLPQWNCVPRCRDVESHQLLVLDAEDNLFLVSPSSGDVYVCQNLASGSPDDFNWKKLIEGPPVFKKQSNFFSILGWGSDRGSAFSSVSGGDGCIWCLTSGGKEVFQLVLKYVKKSIRGEKGVKVSIEGFWKKFELPEKDEVTLFAADKMDFDVLCGVVQENRVVTSYALLQENSGRLMIPNPEEFDSLRWKSISICALSKPDESPIPSASKSLNSSISSHVSIYPKLPPLEGHDFCCENGDCSFCRSATEEFSWVSGETTFVTSFEDVSEWEKSKVNTRTAKRLSTGEGTPEAKRSKISSSSTPGEETPFRKGKRSRGEYDEEGVAYSSKRPRLEHDHQLLIADIPFMMEGRFHLNPSDYEVCVCVCVCVCARTRACDWLHSYPYRQM